MLNEKNQWKGKNENHKKIDKTLHETHFSSKIVRKEIVYQNLPKKKTITCLGCRRNIQIINYREMICPYLQIKD